MDSGPSAFAHRQLTEGSTLLERGNVARGSTVQPVTIFCFIIPVSVFSWICGKATPYLSFKISREAGCSGLVNSCNVRRSLF